MKSLKQPQKTKEPKAPSNVTETLALEHLRPLLHEGFGKDAADKLAAERKRDLAVLRILELVVAGEIPQRPNEDYFMTTCRMIGSGRSEAKTSARAKRAIDQAVADIIATSRWRTGPAEIAKMRAWRGKSAITRVILLLNALEKLIGPADLKGWMETPNPNLDGRTPAYILHKGRWSVLADAIDDMLTGSPT